MRNLILLMLLTSGVMWGQELSYVGATRVASYEGGYYGLHSSYIDNQPDCLESIVTHRLYTRAGDPIILLNGTGRYARGTEYSVLPGYFSTLTEEVRRRGFFNPDGTTATNTCN